MTITIVRTTIDFGCVFDTKQIFFSTGNSGPVKNPNYVLEAKMDKEKLNLTGNNFFIL